MGYRLGVDLGTTWTAAATSDGRAEVLQLGTHTLAMPSVVAFDGDDVVVGEAAERRLAADPTCGAREVKRRLGDTTPMIVGGKPYGPEALMAPLLADVIARATTQLGGAPDTVTLTHPANWGEYKLDLLREIGRLAGRDDVELLPEPVAAALHYVHLGRVNAGDAVAVYDFGGGTFDVAVVHCDPDGGEILGSPNGLERLGGVDLDQIILVQVDSALDGKLRELDSTQPEVRSAIAQLRGACTAAKEALSADADAVVPVALPGLQTEVRITRPEFEAAVRARIEDTIGALDRAVASAGVDMGAIAGVLLVGGSSRIPVVSELVTSRTGRPVLVDADAKAVVALGAAGAAASVDAAAQAAVATADTTDDAAARAGAPAAVAGAGAAAAAVASNASGGGSGGGAAGGASGPSRGARVGDATRRAASAVGSAVRERGATVAGAAAGVAAAGGAIAAGVLAYDRLTDDDGGGSSAAAHAHPQPDAHDDAGGGGHHAAAAAGDDNMDAFESAVAAVGGAGVGGAAGVAHYGGGVAHYGGVASGGHSGVTFSDSPAGRVAAHLFAPTATQHEPEPSGAGAGAFGATATMTHAPTTGGLFSDPQLEQVRQQLADRLDHWQPPQGADPHAVDEMKTDLQNLLEHFHAYPGQSVDDAVASLRYSFEDRVHDFAQDQKIDALINDHQQEQANAQAVGAQVDDLRTQLEDRLANWQPPAGADAQAVADMKADLQGMLDRFQAVPGQSANDALADLRSRFNDRVHDFAQDQKIGAVVDQLGVPDPAPGATTTMSDTTMPTNPTAMPGTTTSTDTTATTGTTMPTDATATTGTTMPTDATATTMPTDTTAMPGTTVPLDPTATAAVPADATTTMPGSTTAVDPTATVPVASATDPATMPASTMPDPTTVAAAVANDATTATATSDATMTTDAPMTADVPAPASDAATTVPAADATADPSMPDPAVTMPVSAIVDTFDDMVSGSSADLHTMLHDPLMGSTPADAGAMAATGGPAGDPTAAPDASVLHDPLLGSPPPPGVDESFAPYEPTNTGIVPPHITDAAPTGDAGPGLDLTPSHAEPTNTGFVPPSITGAEPPVHDATAVPAPDAPDATPDVPPDPTPDVSAVQIPDLPPAVDASPDVDPAPAMPDPGMDAAAPTPVADDINDIADQMSLSDVVPPNHPDLDQ